jgi:hypothetical protein
MQTPAVDLSLNLTLFERIDANNKFQRFFGRVSEKNKFTKHLFEEILKYPNLRKL